MRNGALLACDEINRDPRFAFALAPIEADPGSELSAYAPAIGAMLDQGARHVVGCYTSSSRKDIIPIVEKRDALLWYPTHYEGFESASNVIYTGAAPNHHMMPLIDHLVGRHATRVFCVGSNYIWAWESNRVMREAMSERGGTVLAEHYLPVGDTDLDHVIDAILQHQPDVVFNTLIGRSAYAFFESFRAACRVRGIDQAQRFPIASCNLSEPELLAIDPTARDGHVSASVYFASIRTPRNAAFVAAYDAAYPSGPAVSAEAEAAYLATWLLAEAIAAAGTDDIAAVRDAAPRKRLDAPQGAVWLDPATLHAHLTPRIGLSRADGQFDILFEAAEPMKPDPYLVETTSRLALPRGRPRLRVVS